MISGQRLVGRIYLMCKYLMVERPCLELATCSAKLYGGELSSTLWYVSSPGGMASMLSRRRPLLSSARAEGEGLLSSECEVRQGVVGHFLLKSME